jgi:hypothetical protein
MSLNISPSTAAQRKQLFVEILLSKTNKINKVSDNAITNAMAYGVGKVSGKAEKDIIQALSQLFPDDAWSTGLDQCAQNFGITTRFGASVSSTYVRVVGAAGTVYTAGVNVFSSNTGVQFNIEKTVVIGSSGFAYVPVRSITTGSSSNVDPGTITSITPTPTGHQFCVNEYQALGGRDQESDIDYRQRIKNGPDILAKGTIAAIEQAFMLINGNILEVIYQGINGSGQLQLAIVTQNGIALNDAEIDTLLVQAETFFGLAELRPFGRKSYGVNIYNINVQPIDVSFRCQLQPSAIADNVRIAIQVAMSKYVDPRYFQSGIDYVDWTVLLELARNVSGMKNVPDTYFYPNANVPTDPNSIIRIRGFEMLNLDGSIINNSTGSFNPVYYPNVGLIDFNYWASVLKTI